jgi:hypothetical protein
MSKRILILIILCNLFGVLSYASNDLSLVKITKDCISIKTGDHVTFTVSLQNNKNAVENIVVTGGIDGNRIYERTLARIDAAGMRKLNFTWTASPGEHTVWFEIDPKQQSQNNRIEIKIKVEPSQQTSTSSNTSSNLIHNRKNLPMQNVPAPGSPPNIAHPINLPDLVMKKFTANYSSDASHPLRSVWKLVIANEGGLPADDMFIYFISDCGAPVGELKVPAYISHLNPYTATTVNEFINRSYSEGGHNCKDQVVIDPANDVIESNENNNKSLIETYVLPCKPELVFDPDGWNIVQNPPGWSTGAIVGQMTDRTIGIKNIGCGASPSFVLLIQCDEQPQTPIYISSIAQGAISYDAKFKFKWNSVGLRKCVLTIDSNNQIAEFDENNNKWDIWVSVHN